MVPMYEYGKGYAQVFAITKTMAFKCTFSAGVEWKEAYK